MLFLLLPLKEGKKVTASAEKGGRKGFPLFPVERKKKEGGLAS